MEDNGIERCAAAIKNSSTATQCSKKKSPI